MATLRPLVNISGSVSELPEGDFLFGAVGGTLTTSSGVVGGGSLQQGTPLALSVSLAASASGLIRTGNSIGLDGASFRTTLAANASGLAAIATSSRAVASGNFASSVATQALASGNAALSAVRDVPYGSIETFTAASTIPAGYPVGLDDTNRAQVIRSNITVDRVTVGSFSLVENIGNIVYSSDIAWNTTNDRFCVVYRNSNNNYGYAAVGSINPTTGAITIYTPVIFNSATTIYVSIEHHVVDNRFIICWLDSGNNYQARSAQLSGVNSDTLTFGTGITAATGSSSGYVPYLSYDPIQQRTLLVATHGTLQRLLAVSISCTSGVLSAGTAAAGAFTGSTLYDSGNLTYCGGPHLYVYRRPADGFATGIAFTISGAAVTVGTATVLISSAVNFVSSTYNTSQGRFVALLNRTSSSSGIATGTVSGTTITVLANSDVINESSGGYGYGSVVYSSAVDRLYFNLHRASSPYYNRYYVYSQAGNTFTYLYQSPIENIASLGSGSFPFSHIIAIPSLRSALQVLNYLINYDQSNVYVRLLSEGAIIHPSKNNKQNFIGVATTTAASGSAVTVRMPGSYSPTSPTVLQSGAFYYLEPSISGYTTGVTQPYFWSGDKTWGPVGIALDTSRILITDTM